MVDKISELNYLVIDSKNGVGTSTNFSYQLQNPIVIKKFIQMVYCSIPNTNYLIESGYNDAFKISFLDDPTFTVKEFTIPAKNYTSAELATTITSLINFDNCTISYDANTYKFSMSADNYNFTLNNISNNCYSILGWPYPQVSISKALYVKYGLDFVSPSLLYILINNLDNYKIHGKNTSGTFIIPIQSSTSEINIYSNNSEFTNVMFVNTDVVLNNIEIKIKKDDSTIYNNQNMSTK